KAPMSLLLPIDQSHAPILIAFAEYRPASDSDKPLSVAPDHKAEYFNIALLVSMWRALESGFVSICAVAFAGPYRKLVQCPVHEPRPLPFRLSTHLSPPAGPWLHLHNRYGEWHEALVYPAPGGPQTGRSCLFQDFAASR